jgi:3-hydroxy acid dehydrogenase/malonic semialdehyde reductase
LNVILAAQQPEVLKQVAEQCTAAHKESNFSAGISGKIATVKLDVSDRPN